MSDLAVCRRYAAALLEEAEEKGILAQVDADVAMTRTALEESRELHLLFMSPVISIAKKDSIIIKLFADHVTEVFQKFLLLLNEKGREHLILDVLGEYRAHRNEQMGIVEAEARTAMALSDPEVEALRELLASRTGADVQLHVEEDPALLGGIVVRVGDTVYDGSLKRKLSALRSQLRGGSFLSN